MENASKALIMAGSVLMAILVIGLLVFGYQSLSALEQSKENAKGDLKAEQYMERFEQFDRTLYGSELLSLANLLEDYNSIIAFENEGYTEMRIKVYTTGIKGEDEDAKKYFSKGEHSITKILEDKNDIEEEIAKYEVKNSNYNNKSVKYYSEKSNRQIAEEFGIDVPGTTPDYDIAEKYLEINTKTNQLLKDIQDYKSLTTIYNEFRIGKKFECTKIEYDDNNGRITYMYFKEKTK